MADIDWKASVRATPTSILLEFFTGDAISGTLSLVMAAQKHGAPNATELRKAIAEEIDRRIPIPEGP